MISMKKHSVVVIFVFTCLLVLGSCVNKNESSFERHIELGGSVYSESEIRSYLKDVLINERASHVDGKALNSKDRVYLWNQGVVKYWFALG